MVIERKGNIFDSMANVICHQVNCQGVMGAGIAKEIRKRFPIVYEEFQETYKSKENKLGNIDVVDVCYGNRFIVNMYSQDNYLPRGVQHTDYEAFRTCLSEIKGVFFNKRKEITIAFPHGIGCGLGGGDWKTIMQIIDDEFYGDEWLVEIWKLQKKRI